jgi:predicted transcriptional regulator
VFNINLIKIIINKKYRDIIETDIAIDSGRGINLIKDKKYDIIKFQQNGREKHQKAVFSGFMITNITEY